MVGWGVQIPEGLSDDLRASSVDRDGKTCQPSVEVVGGSGQPFDGASAPRFVHVLDRRQDQLVVGGIVPKDGPGTHTRQLGDLGDSGVEAPPGHDCHRGLSDA